MLLRPPPPLSLPRPILSALVPSFICFPRRLHHIADNVLCPCDCQTLIKVTSVVVIQHPFRLTKTAPLSKNQIMASN